ncbi:oligosaccharide flippase family protein [Hyalangium rubrum]|uniref:Oligosaccharide flippase family protein n=1 Tax=Hyalangium rubrum TaxID=3103134 RepID=A0ABU5H0M4_9BACT|nr:oligosaccharide flippase family protein [Hyalangium sp. s54d21]MDY7226997.1 oligosaccharide flippase family protein [Hyalangium sp. s54d21]
MNATAAPEVTTAEVKDRAQKGVFVLAARTAVSQGLRVVSALCLSRLLFPGDYGLFGIVSYATSLGVFLGDLGLSAALVHQAREPSKDEASTVFWCHQALTALIVLAIIALAPSLVEGYALGAQALPMIYVMALGLFLSSLRVLPLMALERKLAFPEIARAELIENVAQVAATIGLAALGCGAWSLVGGGLVRGVSGLFFIWRASPWRPQGSFRLDVVRRLLGFGLAFQLPPLVGTLAVGWGPLVVGQMLGKEAVGYFNWAAALAATPMMFSTILNRVAFPAYCRMQDDPAGFAEYLRTSLRRLTAALCLFVPLLVLAVPVAVPLFFGERWVPAVPFVQWFSMEAILNTLVGLLGTAQNAGGRPWQRFAVASGFGVVRWSLGLWLVSQFGYAGVGPVGLLASLGEMWVTVWLVTRLNPALKGLVFEVVEPFLSVSFALLGIYLAVPLLLPEGLWGQGFLGVALFLGVFLVRERVPGVLPLVTELRTIAALIQARLRRAAPRVSAST